VSQRTVGVEKEPAPNRGDKEQLRVVPFDLDNQQAQRFIRVGQGKQSGSTEYEEENSQ
jgi:hypothetical protein